MILPLKEGRTSSNAWYGRREERRRRRRRRREEALNLHGHME